MNITNENKVRIYRKDFDGKPSYSVGLSKKKEDGTWENGYKTCKFRKDVVLEDKTDIYIKEAWLTFNIKDKKTYDYIFINDFDTVEKKLEELPKMETTDPFEEMGKQVKMEDYPISEDEDSLELPF